MSLSVILQRALALTLVVAAALLAYLVLVAPLWQSHQMARDATVEHEAQIVRMLALAADAKRLSEQRDLLRIQGKSERYLIRGASPTLAAAGLQKRIEAIAEQAGGRLGSTQVLPSQTEDDFVRVAIRVRLALDTPTLQRVLYEFEGQPPLLVIDDVVVIARGGHNIRQTRQAPANLDVQFRLSGWMPRRSRGA